MGEIPDEIFDLPDLKHLNLGTSNKHFSNWCRLCLFVSLFVFDQISILMKTFCLFVQARNLLSSTVSTNLGKLRSLTVLDLRKCLYIFEDDFQSWYNEVNSPQVLLLYFRWKYASRVDPRRNTASRPDRVAELL